MGGEHGGGGHVSLDTSCAVGNGDVGEYGWGWSSSGGVSMVLVV
jgi:hypothetical protein